MSSMSVTQPEEPVLVSALVASDQRLVSKVSQSDEVQEQELEDSEWLEV